MSTVHAYPYLIHSGRLETSMGTVTAALNHTGKILYSINLTSVVHRENNIEPWLVWLGGLSASLQTKGSLVRFPIRAHAWIAGQVPSWECKMQPHIDVSLPLILHPFSSLK